MAAKPILFNTEMVKAILDGRKTQTRRVAFPNSELREFQTEQYPTGWWFNGRVFKSFDDFLHYPQSPQCKYKPGDILWVRETWLTNDGEYHYKADDECPFGWYRSFWKPSIHMPKGAARIFLRVKDVRVERLHAITVEDCMWEGLRRCDPSFCPITYGENTECDKCSSLQSYMVRFLELWNSTIKPADLAVYSFQANPWVWVIEFERCEKPEEW